MGRQPIGEKSSSILPLLCILLILSQTVFDNYLLQRATGDS